MVNLGARTAGGTPNVLVCVILNGLERFFQFIPLPKIYDLKPSLLLYCTVTATVNGEYITLYSKDILVL